MRMAERKEDGQDQNLGDLPAVRIAKVLAYQGCLKEIKKHSPGRHIPTQQEFEHYQDVVVKPLQELAELVSKNERSGQD